MEDSLELSPPTTLKKDITTASAKKLQVHVPPLKTSAIAPQKTLERGGYHEDEDDFNKLLNSSPKKAPKYTNSVKKNREWEALEAAEQRNQPMHGFDELLEDHHLDEDDETTNPRHSPYGQSPTIVNKDLTRDLGMKERKASVLNQGISLMPVLPPASRERATNMDQKYDKMGKYSMSMEGGAHPTETTKANGRSNFNAEESMANGFDDDDEFDKFIGRIAAPSSNVKGIS